MSNSSNVLFDWEIDSYVGENNRYYKEKWGNNKNRKYFKGWNWVALFFPLEWFAYRKMYLEAFLFFIFSFLTLIIVQMIFPFSDLITDLISDSIQVITALFANALYKRKTFREAIKTRSLELESAQKILAQKGGVSKISVFITVVFEIIFGVIVYLL